MNEGLPRRQRAHRRTPEHHGLLPDLTLLDAVGCTTAFAIIAAIIDACTRICADTGRPTVILSSWRQVFANLLSMSMLRRRLVRHRDLRP